ncbi:hypothetical protein Poli38472_013492 [Pythium oligandrum]|uniref:Uncharacterized protein n=1 Tax=Pythium oligandrum TaxID=41045 RepID=A0A8K1FGR5_PYTOL|nr:hypothetical protein Poli38472_013492 [Pythium oligandrum]|eukprot:TMW58018.1 hypothetical protein Poli38472_013492 [Pythium oligandrum]
MSMTRPRRKPTSIAVKAAKTTESPPAPPRRRRKCSVTVDITACRYAIIRKCLRERDFRLVKKKPDGGIAPPKWDIWWSDRGDLLRELPRLSPFQKVNHFPSMEEICRKDFLANNLNAIFKVLPADFDFFPRSFLIPAESVELQKAMENGPKNATYIAKPRTLCQGKGISLIQSFSKLPNELCVVQRYIDNPLLIDGFKFDLRIYVLVLSVHPLRVHIFRNGLARFCTTPFEKPTRKNLSKKRMHLTNYAINKNSKDFQKATTTSSTGNQGSKRSLASVMAHLDASGRGSSTAVWQQICDIVIKTLLCIEPKLQASYKSYFGAKEATETAWGSHCFEILGFDIMLDATCKAWLFEVNHAPSFAGDSPLDREVKSALIAQTLDLVDVTNEKKLQFVRQTRSEWTQRLWSTSQKSKQPEKDETTNQQSSRPESREEQPEEMAPSDESDTEEGSSSNNEPGSEGEEEDATQRGTSTTLSDALDRCSIGLKNVFSRRNRIAPDNIESGRSTTEERQANEPSFTNAFALLYPTDANQAAEYERVRVAAQVNRSKLWQ